MVLKIEYQVFILTTFALPIRRDARAVEWGGLENRYTLTGIQGSNPCLSAKQNPPNRPLKAAQESAKPVETSLLDRERAFALSVSGTLREPETVGGILF